MKNIDKLFHINKSTSIEKGKKIETNKIYITPNEFLIKG